MILNKEKEEEKMREKKRKKKMNATNNLVLSRNRHINIFHLL